MRGAAPRRRLSAGCARSGGLHAPDLAGRRAPQASLDTIAYGQTYAPAAVPVAYAAPAPVRYDVAYHLDAGDKLRVVVYGQEGLTNTYAIDAGGSITMPLIGSVPARGRTPAGLAADISGQPAQRLYPRALGRGRDRGLPPVLHPRRGGGPRPISLCAEHDGGERGRHRRRLLAARAPRPRHGHAYRRVRHGRFVVPPGTPISPGDTVLVGERWF